MNYQLTITECDDGMPIFLIDAEDGSIETIVCDRHTELFEAIEKLGINRQDMQVWVY